LDVWKEDNLFEGDHENAVEKKGREHILVDGYPRHAQNSGKMFLNKVTKPKVKWVSRVTGYNSALKHSIEIN
jgi:hypothetical protein